MQGPPPPLRNPVDAMRQYLDLVDKYTELAKDPSASGVSAVVTLFRDDISLAVEAAMERGDSDEAFVSIVGNGFEKAP